MKTTSELNQKWWYRLLKVVYLSAVLFASIITIWLVFDDFSPKFDNKTSYVQCNNEIKYFVDKIGMYSDYVGSYNDEIFRTWCSTTLVTENGERKLKLISGPVPKEKNYTFIAEYTPRDWTGTIVMSLISVIVICIIFEIGRRIFYYVVLGSIRPKNKQA